MAYPRAVRRRHARQEVCGRPGPYHGDVGSHPRGFAILGKFAAAHQAAHGREICTAPGGKAGRQARFPAMERELAPAASQPLSIRVDGHRRSAQ
jgi:hypothetical protein